jgi:tRNA A37 threonylcarbamoyladenosine dehydratase
MKVKEEFVRSAMLLGEDGIDKLAAARVAVFGVGGVGGYICEALARAGVGELHLFDNDVVSLSNINRQIVALHSTVGRPKVEVMKERILDINPDCKVVTNQVFYLPENADDFPLLDFDYVADAIDTVSAKIELAVRCAAAGIPLISAMGTGNKLDATRFTVTDLSKTSGCPLARVMRRELKSRGITHLKVVYSSEPPVTPPDDAPSAKRLHGRTPPASISFVPPAAGLMLAGEIIRDLIKE